MVGHEILDLGIMVRVHARQPALLTLCEHSIKGAIYVDNLLWLVPGHQRVCPRVGFSHFIVSYSRLLHWHFMDFNSINEVNIRRPHD